MSQLRVRQLIVWLCFVGLLGAPTNGLNTLEERMADLEHEQAVMKDQLKLKLDAVIEATRGIQKDKGPRHAAEEDQIAFSVVSQQQFGPVGADTNVPFEVVHTNIGGAWHTQTNSFQAPRSGAYLFTASIMGNSNRNTAQANIVHTTAYGSVNTASLYSHGSEYLGDANSVILEVDEGDFVSVQLLAGSGVLFSTSSQVFSTFSGFFLFP